MHYLFILPLFLVLIMCVHLSLITSYLGGGGHFI